MAINAIVQKHKLQNVWNSLTDSEIGKSLYNNADHSCENTNADMLSGDE